MGKSVRFEVDVTGVSDPFTWKLFKIEGGASARSAVVHEAKAVAGEEPTKERAIWAGRDAAEEAFNRWVHTNTTESIPLFRGRLTDEGEAVTEPVKPLNPVPQPNPMEFTD